MFAKRNSVTLAILWLVLLITGIFLYIKDTGNVEAAIEEKKKYQEQLKKSQSQIERLKDVENVHADMKENWLNAPKRIISADEPSFTLSYLNWIMSSNNLVIDFDFVLNQKNKTGDHTRFTYTLTGEATYNDIYRLIWYLTYEPILYKINYINLQKRDTASEYLKFNIKLQGYTVEGQSALDDDFGELRPRDDSKLTIQTDIFEPLVKPKPVVVKKPKVSKPKLPPKLPGQIDVEKATLKAVTNNSVFVSEGGSGLVELKIGDPVYLGSLVRIDQDNNQAEFLIKKFGVTKSIILKIDERN
ncbi:hypothetical protein GWN42_32925 [candidate division KSB1 bacterium]|nr:hypothetical protein [candidate division KSB1 bacterium]